MDEHITIRHELSSFSVTEEPRLVESKIGKEIYVITGISTAEVQRVCPVCGSPMHRHGMMRRKLQDIDLSGHLCIIEVIHDRMRCSSEKCNHTQMQDIEFREPGHNITIRLGRRIRTRLNSGNGISETARSLSVHPNIIYEIDKENLQRLAGSGKAPYAQYIGIDEFKLHDGHRYATVVSDLRTGQILFLEAGKKKEQAYHFFSQMGDAWMRKVKAVAMDMNAQYDSAFREKWPHIAVIYDHFHLVKLYNDTVITAIRRRKQAELLEKGDEEGYTLLKNSRYILLSSIATLEAKDKAAHENNARLHRDYLDKGRPLPPGERIMHADKEQKLKDILAENEDLSISYFLLEQFNLAYNAYDLKLLFNGMKAWIRLARQSNIPEILSFCDTVQKHFVGIVLHAVYPISSGRVEGINNMIKTIRRKAYGYRDTEYFFLKIKFASLRGRYEYLSHKKL